MFLNIVFFSCVCLFVPCVYVIKIIIIKRKLYIITKVLLYLHNTRTQSQLINSASEATGHRNGELLYA